MVHATGHALQHRNIQLCFVRELGGVEILEILSKNSNPRYDYGQFYLV